MFNNVLVTVKSADKTRRAYKRMISARLHRGFHMFPSPVKVYQQEAALATKRLNVSSGEDAFIGEANVFC